ncbi:hypothetical protein ACFS07_14605 [Undibacterium arcticum]
MQPLYCHSAFNSARDHTLDEKKQASLLFTATKKQLLGRRCFYICFAFCFNSRGVSFRCRFVSAGIHFSFCNFSIGFGFCFGRFCTCFCFALSGVGFGLIYFYVSLNIGFDFGFFSALTSALAAFVSALTTAGDAGAGACAKTEVANKPAIRVANNLFMESF